MDNSGNDDDPLYVWGKGRNEPMSLEETKRLYEVAQKVSESLPDIQFKNGDHIEISVEFRSVKHHLKAQIRELNNAAAMTAKMIARMEEKTARTDDEDSQAYAPEPVTPPAPPAGGFLLVSFLTPRDQQEVVQGDLEERYGKVWLTRGPRVAAAWYRIEIIKTLGSYALRATRILVGLDIVKRFLSGQ